MALIQIKRGLAAAVDAATLHNGEPAWASDTKRLSVGDGTTPGGVGVAMQADLAAEEAARIAADSAEAAARAAADIALASAIDGKVGGAASLTVAGRLMGVASLGVAAMLSLASTVAGGIATITGTLTDNRSYTLPDASGTIALTSDLSAYLPLSGGTLTGNLVGTRATFAGSDAAAVSAGQATIGGGVGRFAGTVHCVGLTSTAGAAIGGALTGATTGSFSGTITSTAATGVVAAISTSAAQTRVLASGLGIAGIEFYEAGVRRAYLINEASGATHTWRINAYDLAGTFIDRPIDINMASGGTFATSRPFVGIRATFAGTDAGIVSASQVTIGGGVVRAAGAVNCVGLTSTGGVAVGGALTGATSGAFSGTVTTPRLDCGTGSRGRFIANSAAAIAASGTIDLSINTTGGGYIGTLTVFQSRDSNANVSTRTVYAIIGRGTTASITSLATQNGSLAASAFTVSVPSNGVVRVTNNDTFAVTTDVSFLGTLGL